MLATFARRYSFRMPLHAALCRERLYEIILPRLAVEVDVTSCFGRRLASKNGHLFPPLCFLPLV